MNRPSQKFVGIALLTICGCAAEQPPVGSELPAPAAVTPADSGKPETKVATDEPKGPSIVDALASYEPPFPGRQDMFTPPAQSGNHRANTDSGAVYLRGFVDIDQPHAILDIEGVIAPLPVGGEKYGVKVVSIEPPRVVLERNRTRFTASLE